MEAEQFLRKMKSESKAGISFPSGPAEVFVACTKPQQRFSVHLGSPNDEQIFEGEVSLYPDSSVDICLRMVADPDEKPADPAGRLEGLSLTGVVGREEFVCLSGSEPSQFLYTCEVLPDIREKPKGKMASFGTSHLEAKNLKSRFIEGVIDLPEDLPAKDFWEREYGKKLAEGTAFAVNPQIAAAFVQSDPGFLDWLTKRYTGTARNLLVVMKRYDLSTEEFRDLLAKKRKDEREAFVPDRKADAVFVGTSKEGHWLSASFGKGAREERFEGEFVFGPYDYVWVEQNFRVGNRGPFPAGKNGGNSSFSAAGRNGTEEFVCLTSLGSKHFLYTTEVVLDLCVW
jgi:hypothetical protein